MTDHYPRIMNLYGQQPPVVQWPDDNQLAINLVLNYEEGSELCPLDGDPYSEQWLTDLPGIQPRNSRHYSCESLFSYGARSGGWRILNLLKETGVTATVFACGLALERNPELAEAFTQADLEIAGHGWRWIDYSEFSPEIEKIHIQKTLDSIFNLTGQKAEGWYTGRKSPHTRALVIQAGLLYDSDAYDDDLPYYLLLDNRFHMVIPYTLVCNDCRYSMSPGWNSPEDAWFTMKATFDSLYRESKSQPRMMTVGLHTRLSGHPGRADTLKRFIDYAQHHKGVWFCQRRQIAHHWRKVSPP
ncbi:polysaccharide deacetylase family protein [Sansalvadorimonas sp. 2012CJ34-2]|uniref:Polysaccharide deacetylase family protein n=1 Tax=Parendozoicomonas callyspongiae TaxID=2942213 RepID=A0ABT0PGF4_9GAMM|nr:polysaccharide deacetylase family protein [Sansalvadorimonas sp. 2012CJ34-2]MCL6270336.1 polysaccharide deacetylase family protein [Sansalvadorimonas sp. 2012CJ34-2]